MIVEEFCSPTPIKFHSELGGVVTSVRDREFPGVLTGLLFGLAEGSALAANNESLTCVPRCAH